MFFSGLRELSKILYVKDPDRNQVHRVASQIIISPPIPSPSLLNFFFLHILSLFRHLFISTENMFFSGL